jgi:hypothetical protein
MNVNLISSNMHADYNNYVGRWEEISGEHHIT